MHRQVVKVLLRLSKRKQGTHFYQFGQGRHQGTGIIWVGLLFNCEILNVGLHMKQEGAFALIIKSTHYPHELVAARML